MIDENFLNNLEIELTKKDAINRFVEDKLKKRKIIYYILLGVGINYLFGGLFLALLYQIFAVFLIGLVAERNSVLLFNLILIIYIIGIIL